MSKVRGEQQMIRERQICFDEKKRRLLCAIVSFTLASLLYGREEKLVCFESSQWPVT